MCTGALGAVVVINIICFYVIHEVVKFTVTHLCNITTQINHDKQQNVGLVQRALRICEYSDKCIKLLINQLESSSSVMEEGVAGCTHAKSMKTNPSIGNPNARDYFSFATPPSTQEETGTISDLTIPPPWDDEQYEETTDRAPGVCQYTQTSRNAPLNQQRQVCTPSAEDLSSVCSQFCEDHHDDNKDI